MNDVVIFLGPTLSLKTAKKILPNALFLPPAQCGDVTRVTRLHPKIIAIIDGFFEHTPAIWHKEILYALEQNIQVMGASSMGALRAAELAPYGMIGIGEIYKQFYQKQLIDDDEVAVLHSPAQSNYQPLTDAMVNIRATLKKAVLQQIIPSTIATLIIDTAKSLHYRERNLTTIIEKLQLPINTKKLKTWLQTNYTDQKKLDAVKLLETIATSSEHKKNLAIEFNNKMSFSRFFRLLHKSTMCQTFPKFYEKLSVKEQILLTIREQKNIYFPLQRLAHLLWAVTALSNIKTQNVIPIDFFNLKAIADEKNWSLLNNCDAAEKSEFLERMQKIQLYINYSLQKYDENDFIFTFLFFLRLSGAYKTYKKDVRHNGPTEVYQRFQQEDPLQFIITKFSAYLWHTIILQLRKNAYNPYENYIREYSDRFLQSHGLYTIDQIQNWLEINDLSLNEYQTFITLMVSFKFLILEGNLDILNAETHLNVFWLLDAAYLTGTFSNILKGKLDPHYSRLSNLKI